MKMSWNEAVEFKFKIKDEDSLFKLIPEKEFKSIKDETVEHAMDQVGDALSGKNFRRMLGAIEQQIRYAYQKGYEEGVKSCLEAVNFNDLLVARYDTGFDDGYNKGLEVGKVALREWKRKITEVINEDK